MVVQQVPAVINTLKQTGDTFITDMKKNNEDKKHNTAKYTLYSQTFWKSWYRMLI